MSLQRILICTYVYILLCVLNIDQSIIWHRFLKNLICAVKTVIKISLRRDIFWLSANFCSSCTTVLGLHHSADVLTRALPSTSIRRIDFAPFLVARALNRLSRNRVGGVGFKSWRRPDDDCVCTRGGLRLPIGGERFPEVFRIGEWPKNRCSN